MSAPAFAEITEVTVNSTAIHGRSRQLYREIHATMEGAAPGGAYAVPVSSRSCILSRRAGRRATTAVERLGLHGRAAILRPGPEGFAAALAAALARS